MLKDQGLIQIADASISDLNENDRSIRAGSKVQLEKINSATWFLPIVTHALKGGVRTVFTFAERMSAKWGTINIFVIYSHSGQDFDIGGFEQSLAEHFPGLRFLVRKFIRGQDEASSIPHADIAFCTLWTTAYLLLKYNQVHKKFYFMQDYEPLFYEAGSVYAAIEQTYRFGFSCIANTPGVGNKYLQYSNDVTHFFPGVDSEIFNTNLPKAVSDKFRVVFYGRPGNSRNCFSLGVLTLKALKLKMMDKVEILSVGAEWDVAEYGLEGTLENLGLLSSLNEVARLYRNSDLGLVFMVTPHPSYQPLEYMACGCVVATNINESNGWLLNHINSLQLEPIPEIAAQRICDLLVDRARLDEIRTEAYNTIKVYNWNDAFSVFEKRILGGSEFP